MGKIDKISVNGAAYEIVPEIAPLFNTTTAYAAGDCVIKDAVLYRFTTAHAVGAWIGTDAEEVTVGRELTDLKADLSRIGLSDDVKTSLLACFSHVAWIDVHGQGYYDALEAALYADSYPRITAVFDAGVNVIYMDDTLDTLKQYLTVKYFETKDSAGTVIASNDYTLSGVLTEGTSTITVAYNGIRTLVSIPGVVDFYNIHEWSYPGLIQIQQQKSPGFYTPTGAETGSLGVYEYTNNIRMCLTTGRGKYPYIHRLTGELYDFYPIPVPNDAVSVTLTWNSNDINMGISQWKYAQDPIRYFQQGSDSGWQTSPYTFTLPTNDNNRFVSVNIRNTSNTDIAALQIPSEITVTFNVN